MFSAGLRWILQDNKRIPLITPFPGDIPSLPDLDHWREMDFHCLDLQNCFFTLPQSPTHNQILAEDFLAVSASPLSPNFNCLILWIPHFVLLTLSFRSVPKTLATFVLRVIWAHYVHSEHLKATQPFLNFILWLPLFEMWSCWIVQASTKFLILLPQPSHTGIMGLCHHTKLSEHYYILKEVTMLGESKYMIMTKF